MNLCLSNLSSRAKAGHSFLKVRAFYFSRLMAFLLAFCLLLVPSLKGNASQSILRELKPLQTFTLETPYIYADSACLIDAHTGTVLYAAEGKLTPEDIPRILESGNRTLAGPTVPPGGLYLTRLWYEDERLND